MRLLKLLGFALAGVIMAIVLLAWVAQFFTGGGEGNPVIWLESLREEARNENDEFGDWRQEERDR